MTNSESNKLDNTKALVGLAKNFVVDTKMDLNGVFNKLIQTYKETTEIIEQEETKREEIRAKKEVKLSIIQAQREFFLNYLDKTFDERRNNFEKLFDVIDNAITKNDNQQLSIGLDSLNKLAAESPFKVIADINALNDAFENKLEFDF